MTVGAGRIPKGIIVFDATGCGAGSGEPLGGTSSSFSPAPRELRDSLVADEIGCAESVPGFVERYQHS